MWDRKHLVLDRKSDGWNELYRLMLTCIRPLKNIKFLLEKLKEKASQTGLSTTRAEPPQTPQFVGRCRGLHKPGGPHGHRFVRPLSRPLKSRVWGHVQDQPRSTCLVRMIWVKDQYAQHWPWTLSNRRQGGPVLLASHG